MRDRDTEPFARLRTAGFAGILTACPLAALADRLVPGQAGDDLADIGLGFIVFCTAVCWMVYACARLVARNEWRHRRHEMRLNGYDRALSAFFPDINLQQPDPGEWKAGRGSAEAGGGSGRAALRLVSPHRESPRSP